MDCLIITGLVIEIFGVLVSIFITDPRPPSIEYQNKSDITENKDGSITRVSKSFDVKDVFVEYNNKLTKYNVIVRRNNRMRFSLLGAIAFGSFLQILALFL
jgi:hypothetical protein